MERTPDPRNSDGRTAAGWSTPTDPAGGDEPRRDPWSTRPDDTGPVPRQTDTRVLHVSGDQPAAAPGSGQDAPPEYGQETGDRTTRPARRSTALLVTLAVVAGLLGGAAGAAVYGAVADEESPVVSSLDVEPAPPDSSAGDVSDVVAVADQILPSVVSLTVGRSGGSGVILSSDGLILTNNHVVQAAGDAGILVTFQDKSTAPAEIVGTDPLTDLAVIQAQDVSGLQPAELGRSSELQVGSRVVAIGAPLGLQGTVTAGIVSALDRAVTAGSGVGAEATTFNAIQTDAPINPGNSGGPLVNMSGQVIGINSAIATVPGSQGSIGLGFAIPIDQARSIAQVLIEDGEATHAELGVSITNARGETRGAQVVEVVPDSAAADAGLQEGDVITQVDDRVISDAATLVATVRSYRPGDEVTITVVRDGETMTIDVALGASEPTS